MREESTIAAISTAVSQSGISLIRISGPQAFEVIDRIYRSPKGKKKLSQADSHTIHYGFIYDDGELIDEVMVSVMRAPRTFTAEDTVEISCHGGVFVTRRVLECVLRHGCSPAAPGEFTKRAFLNGRIDLSQAEAVMDLIAANNQYALEASAEQLQGRLSQKIRGLRSTVLDEVAYIEAALDDPEHISLEGYRDVLREHLYPIQKEIRQLSDSFDNGRLLKEGIRTVILGKPNAGKSSILNVMTGSSRAIVTEIAGTTRDTLEEQLLLDGVSLILTDTAGIRDTQDPVERIGVSRSKEAAAKADLILYVADSSLALDENDREIISLLDRKKSIVLLNKSDLETVTDEEVLRKAGVVSPVIPVSAREQCGLQEVADTIKNMFYSGIISSNNQILITNARQKACLADALEAVNMTLQGIDDGMPEDMLTIDLMNAYGSLGLIIGEEIEEDLADRIFEKFCMGK